MTKFVITEELIQRVARESMPVDLIVTATRALAKAATTEAAEKLLGALLVKVFAAGFEGGVAAREGFARHMGVEIEPSGYTREQFDALITGMHADG